MSAYRPEADARFDHEFRPAPRRRNVRRVESRAWESLPDGVQKVDVDLSTGKASVLSDRELSENDVRAVVDEAGYELVA